MEILRRHPSSGAPLTKVYTRLWPSQFSPARVAAFSPACYICEWTSAQNSEE
jgi:hypothetical protein